ncbi:MAG TPA: twin-arginine translocase subunit TatC [Candidatus Paceibacterota bacterium]|nr:twin-arginine translocase subunit TatC [Candidatus Paceibacterota bacterium]
MHELLDELKVLRNALLRAGGLFLILITVFFCVPIRGESAASLAITQVRHDLLPSGVELIVTGPMDAFVAEAVLAAELALVVVVPVFSFDLYRFVAPGLYPHERRMLMLFLLVSFLLMLAGAAFAYFVVLPAFFRGLFGFLPADVSPLYNLRDTMALAGGMLLTTALLFLLPIGMALLSWMGLVKASFWRQYWRQAVLIALIFSAIITPDGTGITMMLLALPVCGLYFLGSFGAHALSKKGRSILYSSQH